jgi:hypothetical protein
VTAVSDDQSRHVAKRTDLMHIAMPGTAGIPVEWPKPSSRSIRSPIPNSALADRVPSRPAPAVQRSAAVVVAGPADVNPTADYLGQLDARCHTQFRSEYLCVG